MGYVERTCLTSPKPLLIGEPKSFPRNRSIGRKPTKKSLFALPITASNPDSFCGILTPRVLRCDRPATSLSSGSQEVQTNTTQCSTHSAVERSDIETVSQPTSMPRPIWKWSAFGDSILGIAYTIGLLPSQLHPPTPSKDDLVLVNLLMT